MDYNEAIKKEKEKYKLKMQVLKNRQKAQLKAEKRKERKVLVDLIDELLNIYEDALNIYEEKNLQILFGFLVNKDQAKLDFNELANKGKEVLEQINSLKEKRKQGKKKKEDSVIKGGK